MHAREAMKTSHKEKRDLEKQKEEFEKLTLIQEYDDLWKNYLRTYCLLVRAFADAFGEEEVLDIIEKTMWKITKEGERKAWREKFDKNPEAALEEKARSWHDDSLWARFCICDVPLLENGHWELKCFRCEGIEVFRKMNEPKIGMTVCISDFGAVCGWSPRVVMRQPKHMLRGDAYCHQIRQIVDDPKLQWKYSRKTSEKVGWRSIKKLEEI